MYLCIYIDTHLHTAYLDWLNAVLQSNSRCTGKWGSSRPRYIPRPWSTEFGDAIGDQDWVNWEMHWEAEVEWTQRCTLGPWSSQFGDALWGCDPSSVETQLETEVEWTRTYTPRPWSSEVGDAIGDLRSVNSAMLLEAVIERVWRCTWRMFSSKFGDALVAGYWEAQLEG